MTDMKKKVAIIALVVFTVLAIATVAGVFILNGKFVKEAKAVPAAVTAQAAPEQVKPAEPKAAPATVKETFKPTETKKPAEIPLFRKRRVSCPVSGLRMHPCPVFSMVIMRSLISPTLLMMST